MPRALLVAFHFPPAAAIGARRAVRFARHLPAHGWEVAVLAADPASEIGCAVDAALAAGAPDVPLYHAPSRDLVRALADKVAALRPRRRDARSGAPARELPMDRSGAAASGLGLQASGDGPGGRSSAEASDLRSTPPEARGPRPEAPRRGWTQPFKDALSDLLRTPDQSAGWLAPARAAARRAIAEHRPDVVIATAPPWTALLVGALAAAEAGVPFVADLRDPWVGNPYSGPITWVGRALAPVVERWCLRRAALVVANTGPLREHLAARYRQMAARIVTIPNGPDEEARDANAHRAEENVPGYDGVPGELPVKVVHTGTLYGGRDPRVIFEAVRRLLERGAVRPDELAIDLVGPLDVPGIDTAAVRGELRGIVEFVPPVSRAEAKRIAAGADVLLLFQPGAPLQLPAKVFEYLGAGREVLTIAGPGATAEFARDVGLGAVAAPDAPDEIAAALLDLVRRKRTGALRRPSEDAIERYRPERLVGDLARRLDQLVSRDVAPRAEAA